MLRNFLKNKKAQNTAEYALLIALVVAAVIAMQTYAQRAMQARIHDASIYMSNDGGDAAALPDGLKNSVQYEPYYMNSSYDVSTNSVDTKRLGEGLVGADSQDVGALEQASRSLNGVKMRPIKALPITDSNARI